MSVEKVLSYERFRFILSGCSCYIFVRYMQCTDINNWLFWDSRIFSQFSLIFMRIVCTTIDNGREYQWHNRAVYSNRKQIQFNCCWFLKEEPMTFPSIKILLTENDFINLIFSLFCSFFECMNQISFCSGRRLLVVHLIIKGKVGLIFLKNRSKIFGPKF